MRSGTSRFLTGVACFVSIVSLRLSAQTPPTQAAPSTAAQPAPEPEGWAALEPGQGFQVAKTEKGDLWISAYGLFRYLNQLPADQTFVDHLGRERTIDTRNDHGFYLQGSYIFKPANVEVYASTSYVFGDKSAGYSTSDERIVGVNVFPFNTRNVKVNAQLIDGSLTIYVQADEPKDPVERANWLPSPRNADFSLYVRAYWPDEAVTRGQWTPPAVERQR